MREIFVQSMVQATAQDRLTRSLKAHARPTGQQMDFRVGDQVEFYTPVHPDSRPTKHVQGWVGPAKITNINDMNWMICHMNYSI